MTRAVVITAARVLIMFAVISAAATSIRPARAFEEDYIEEGTGTATCKTPTKIKCSGSASCSGDTWKATSGCKVDCYVINPKTQELEFDSGIECKVGDPEGM